jgi:RNA polymerase sigma-70 factor (ECF subfamily)
MGAMRDPSERPDLRQINFDCEIGGRPADLVDDGAEPLIATARSGSEESREALGRLLEQWRAYLLLLANHQLDSDLCPKAGSSDLVQQTLLEAQQGFDGFEGHSAQEWVEWLRAILRHNIDNFVRRYKRTAKRNIAREVPLEEILNANECPLIGEAMGVAAGWSSPSSIVAAREEAEAVRQALARLPAAYRTVIQMRYREGHSFAEIGRHLDRLAEAARKLWFRAIGRLTEELNLSDGVRGQSSAVR